MNKGGNQRGVEPRRFPASLCPIRDPLRLETPQMKYTPVGVDIAKHLIQVHFIDENTGEVVGI